MSNPNDDQQIVQNVQQCFDRYFNLPKDLEKVKRSFHNKLTILKAVVDRGLSLADLHELTKLDPSTIRGHLKNWEEYGIIREYSEFTGNNQRRISKYSVTPSGNELLGKIQSSVPLKDMNSLRTELMTDFQELKSVLLHRFSDFHISIRGRNPQDGKLFLQLNDTREASWREDLTQKYYGWYSNVDSLLSENPDSQIHIELHQLISPQEKKSLFQLLFGLNPYNFCTWLFFWYSNGESELLTTTQKYSLGVFLSQQEVEHQITLSVQKDMVQTAHRLVERISSLLKVLVPVNQ